MSTDPRIPASQRSRIDERLRRRFETPSRRFGPTPLWWWSGEPVTDERLEWQMRRFSDGGIDNLVLINLAPSGPQFDAEADDPPWFSDAWWQRVEHACELARELDMRLWFYDQIGFSGANLQGSITREHPWAAGSTLRRRQGESRGGRAVLQAGEALVAAYTPDGTLRETSDDGILLDAPSDSPLDLITAVPTAFDYLSQDAVRLLMDRVHGEFDRRVPQHLGTVIAGSFQDELPSTNPWTPSFLDEFAARRGYDLRPRLQALFGRTDVSGAKVRSDYYAVRTELTEEALFRPLHDWHDERGMLLGADQSNPARAGLPAQSTQIYTDYPRTHRHVSAVGSDHEGDSKFHASLAKLYGHERVWLEAFHSSGWGGTLEETWDWLMPFLRRGATLYNPHATYFSTVGGWFEWAPPSTDWRQPYWQHYRQFADAVARVTSTMTWGRSDADVAVLHPTATMQASLPLDMPITHFGAPDFDGALTDVARTQRIYLDLVGKDDWFHFHASALDGAGIGFDIVDDASVARAALGGGRISVGEGSWSVVIVPSAVFLEESTATMLLDHLDGGGRVIVVGALPEHACGAAGDDAVVRALAGHRKLERVSGAEEAIAALRGVRDAQYARTDAPMLVRRARRSAIALVGGAYPNGTAHPLRPEAGLERVTDYDFDRERYVRRRRIRVAAPVAQAELWDPSTGARASVPVDVRDGESVLHVETDGAPLVLVAWEEGAAAARPESVGARGPEAIVDLSSGWTGELVPTLDNTWGDLARPRGCAIEALQIWTLDAREHDGEWSTTWATSGQRARVVTTGVADVPDALTIEECDEIVDGTRALSDASWEVVSWSRSRGQRRDSAGELGTKGRVTSEFLVLDELADGAVTTYRTLVQTEHRGEADLVLVAPADVEAWWNGEPVPMETRYTRQARVRVERTANVLEYRLRPEAGRASLWHDTRVRSGFSLYPADGFDRRPEFVTWGDRSDPDGGRGTLTFAHDLPPLDAVASARLVVGAARTATIRLGDVVVGRQAKVEYYESERGSTPAFFSHDVTDAVRRRPREIVVELEGAAPHDVAWVDLVVVLRDGSSFACVSDASWSATFEASRRAAHVVNRYYGQPEARYATSRPHLLPEAHWLRGNPSRGSAALDFHASDSAVPAEQHYRVLLPAGTRGVDLGVMRVARCRLGGRALTCGDGGLTVDPPLQRPTLLEVDSPPTSTHRLGAGLSGPLEVHQVPAPIELGDWRSLGLAAWSGGVRYTRTIDLGTPHDWTLDLGDLRGSVDVEVDGELIGAAFCAPFRFAIPGRSGNREIRITVYNTLGPFLHESTATTWVLPSQTASGLFGPVVAHVREREAQ